MRDTVVDSGHTLVNCNAIEISSSESNCVIVVLYTYLQAYSQMSCEEPLTKENCFIFHMLPY